MGRLKWHPYYPLHNPWGHCCSCSYWFNRGDPPYSHRLQGTFQRVVITRGRRGRIAYNYWRYSLRKLSGLGGFITEFTLGLWSLCNPYSVGKSLPNAWKFCAVGLLGVGACCTAFQCVNSEEFPLFEVPEVQLLSCNWCDFAWSGDSSVDCLSIVW